MTLFYVDLNGAYCGLIAARTLKAATREALREHGTRNIRLVRYATALDVASVRSMGGYVPPGKVGASEEREG